MPAAAKRPAVASWRPECSPRPWTTRSVAQGAPETGQRRVSNAVPSRAAWVLISAIACSSPGAAAGAGPLRLPR
jgi:hypothetical protein